MNGDSELPKSNVSDLVKVFQSTYLTIAQEVMYLVDNIGLNDVERFIKWLKIKYNMENE